MLCNTMIDKCSEHTTIKSTYSPDESGRILFVLFVAAAELGDEEKVEVEEEEEEDFDGEMNQQRL